MKALFHRLYAAIDAAHKPRAAPAGNAAYRINRRRLLTATLSSAPLLAAIVAASAQAKPRVGYGIASYYGKKFAGRKTASGERYNPQAMTAASRTLALGSRIEVTNLDNHKTVTVRVNDRGPYGHNRFLDLSLAAARKLDMKDGGTARVKVRVLSK